MLFSAPNLSLVPGIELISFAICFAYPCFKTLQLLYGTSAKVATEGSTQPASLSFPSKYIQWNIFWVIYALVALTEAALLVYVIPYIPLYLELKSVVFAWLVHDDFLGAGWIWFHFFDAKYGTTDALIVNKYNTIVPAPIKNLLEGGKSHAAKTQ